MGSTWFGFAASAGGHMVAYGRNTMVATFYSLEDHKVSFTVQSERSRFGPGIGSTTAVDFIILTNAPDVWKLHNMETADWDFNLSLGGKVGCIIKNMTKCRTLVSAVSKLTKNSAATVDAMKAASKMTLSDFNEVGAKVREIAKANPAKGDKPEISTFGIPLTPGLEVSLYQQYGKWRIIDVHGNPTVHAQAAGKVIEAGQDTLVGCLHLDGLRRSKTKKQ